jgi:hypothetical protein
MGKASMEYKEVRFVIEDELTQVYVFIEAHGDCPLGVQGWHHKTFPASQSIIDIVKSNEFEDSVLWPLDASGSKEERVPQRAEAEEHHQTENENPLFCFGCCHSSAAHPFPGQPSGERPCCFCTRNPQREEWLKKAKEEHPDWFEDGKANPYTGHWYDGSDAMKWPMDCYHSLDMFEQINKWINSKK